MKLTAASSKPVPVPDPPAVVVASGLTKVFKDFWGRPKARAVDGVDFTVHRGEVFGLLGPNGSGKSTTIKLLLGLLQPTGGRVEVFGQSPHHVATKQRIGYLPEESLLYRFLNAAETLDYYARICRLPPDERRQRTEQLLEMTGLQHAGSRIVGEFSKGMQRRIGLAQALINDPDLVVLDEPTAGLDPLGCREVKDLLLALARRGKTVILSSHLLADVEDVCDRVVIYYGGRVRAMGPLRELLAAPDRLQILTPALPRADLEDALTALRRHTAPDSITVNAPTQTLERFFLGVVEQAQAAQSATSGATAGNRLADYLRAPAEARTPEKILARLSQEVPAAVLPEAEAAAPAQGLPSLVAAARPSVPTASASMRPAAPPAEDSQINAKLAGLVPPARGAAPGEEKP